jgi:hypothetical protein
MTGGSHHDWLFYEKNKIMYCIKTQEKRENTNYQHGNDIANIARTPTDNRR